MYSVFSIDVEEWFHILETDLLSTDHHDWEKYQGRVVEVFDIMLGILDKHNVKATLFFLGWIAEKYPEIVKKAYDRGHEIAAHGYYHELIYNQSREAFRNDVLRTKTLLEKITGAEVIGYRAPGFSITKDTVWAYRILIELGFKYSSSIFPTGRAHGSYKEFGLMPGIVSSNGLSIVEFPMTILRFPLTLFSCFGGGYFRLFPLFWHNIATKLVEKQERPLIFYIHPRDIDQIQPKIDFPIRRKIKLYVNIRKTLQKIDTILDMRSYSPFRDVVASMNLDDLRKIDLRIDEKAGVSDLLFHH